MKWIYALFIRFYCFFIWVVSPFNSKARKWIEGRRNWRAAYARQMSGCVWFHVSSLGEFEQGLPLIEEIRKNKPSLPILVSFFSPSGYEHKFDPGLLDFKAYLPIDTPGNAKDWFDIWKPALVVFVKYDIWPCYINEAGRRNIPQLLISASFRPDQIYFRFRGNYFAAALKKFDYIFTQNESSIKLLEGIGYENAILAGDTRIDRVYKIATQPWSDDALSFFCIEKTIICGSTYMEDEVFIYELADKFPDYRFVIAPHEVNSGRIDQIRLKFQKFGVQLWSEYDSRIRETRILILNTIGILSKSYRYGYFAYIGGGFGSEIHNILEPVSYNIPVIFGPKFHKFEEARQLLDMKGVFTFSRGFQLIDIVNALSDELHYDEIKSILGQYIIQHTGATRKIYECIKEQNLIKVK